jgi:hypothetical protein
MAGKTAFNNFLNRLLGKYLHYYFSKEIPNRTRCFSKYHRFFIGRKMDIGIDYCNYCFYWVGE